MLAVHVPGSQASSFVHGTTHLPLWATGTRKRLLPTTALLPLKAPRQPAHGLHRVFFPSTPQDDVEGLTLFADLRGSPPRSRTVLSPVNNCEGRLELHRRNPLSGHAVGEARQIYLKKFPFIQQNKILRAMLKLVTFYQIEPSWLRLVDNFQGFGHKEELKF